MKKHLYSVISFILIFAFVCSPAAAESITSAPETAAAQTPEAGPVKEVYPKGDTDNSGSVSVDDARFALRIAVNLEENVSVQAKTAADYNEDGSVTVDDARMILRVAVKLPADYDEEAERIKAEKLEAEEASRRAEEEASRKAEEEYHRLHPTEADVPAGAKVIYLTFDDGPSGNTQDVLDILAKYDVRATFFVINSPQYSGMYKKITDAGHTIGLHSYSHTYSQIYSSETAYFDDLNRISDVVFNYTGVRSKIVRFPGGSSNTVSRSYCRGIMTSLAKKLTEQGYVYFDWNSQNNDAAGMGLSAEGLYKYAIAPCGRNNIIMLMHDGRGKSETVKSLARVIEYYKKAGYYFLPLNENSPVCHHKIAN